MAKSGCLHPELLMYPARSMPENGTDTQRRHRMVGRRACARSMRGMQRAQKPPGARQNRRLRGGREQGGGIHLPCLSHGLQAGLMTACNKRAAGPGQPDDTQRCAPKWHAGQCATRPKTHRPQTVIGNPAPPSAAARTAGTPAATTGKTTVPACHMVQTKSFQNTL